jgi:hypothetical protein
MEWLHIWHILVHNWRAWADRSFAITRIVRSRVIASEILGRLCAPGFELRRGLLSRNPLRGITLHTAMAVKLPGVVA